MVVRSPVSYTGSDPRATLLLSQVMIENQSIKLDQYKDDNYGYAIHKKNDHYYYYFPIGTSVSSIPFVWFQTVILNNDMNNRANDKIAQKFIAGIVSVMIFILLYSTAKVYLNSTLSIALALAFWMGTSFSSTLGQALWSHDFASLYALLSILLTLKITKAHRDNYWIFLGFILFMAYLTRPTMSLLTVTIVLYLFLNKKKIIAVKTACMVGLLLVVFAVFSLFEFNQILPDYYLPKRLSSDTFWTAFYGNIFSPSRGLLIFSPFLFLFLVNIKDTFNILNDDKTLILFLSWIILHLIVISKFPHWWAGWSYGPRFMTDVLPAIFLLFVIHISYSYREKSSAQKNIISFFLILTFSIAVYFNFAQGLYNKYTYSWNSAPNIDKYPEYLFDWNYPQFFHNHDRHIKRIREHNFKINSTMRIEILNEYKLKNTQDIASKTSYKFNAQEISYGYGWSYPEKNFIWSTGKDSELAVILPNKKYIGIFTLKVHALGKQKINVYLNDILIGKNQDIIGNEIIKFSFEADILKYDEFNAIKFEYSNPHKSNSNDPRILAMALISIGIE